MVTKFGMGSSALGPVLLGKDSNDYYSLSSQTRQQIEDETRGLIDGAYKRAQDVLKTHRAELDRLANALLEYETLSRDEIERVLRGEKIQRSLDDVSPAAS
jgi:ATP-dependent metalloprotease